MQNPKAVIPGFQFGFVLAGLALVIGLSAQTARSDVVEKNYEPSPYVQITHPEWSRDAVIYELNTRQFTPEGTFTAAAKQLPRLKELGIDIVWLMPVQPIGEKNRKGTLGSPYSIKDYLVVSPELGNLDSLRQFVKDAHDLGMYVILDWVANHTAWDNPLVEQHPEWYSRNWKGEMHSPTWTDWSDVVTLDYSRPGLRKYMTDAMKYWVEEVGMDGFRCDVAGFVPLDFWENLRRELDAIRPVFMLAEWDERDLHARAFDMTYSWDFNDTLHRIAMGKADAGSLNGYYYRVTNTWPRDGMRMVFVSNHDKNAWDGTQFEMYGDALENSIVLSVVSEGMPLIYNGQEAGNPKRLAFFEKDPIEWREHPIGDLYQKLFALKKSNSALWNGAWGAAMVPVFNSAPQQVFSFIRANAEDSVFAVFNFSADAVSVTFQDRLYHGEWRDFLTGESEALDDSTVFEMQPWSYRVFTNENKE
ncbi:alpha-amylase family glycosyl hydrolase [Pseudomonadota bacterium]